jgi:hypothetical protein
MFIDDAVVHVLAISVGYDKKKPMDEPQPRPLCKCKKYVIKPVHVEDRASRYLPHHQ